MLTRLMVLGLYRDLDRQRSVDATVVPSGVWGLLLHHTHARFVYDMVDARLGAADLYARLCPAAHVHPWAFDVVDGEAAGVAGEAQATPHLNAPNNAGSGAPNMAPTKAPPAVPEVVRGLVAFFVGWNRYVPTWWFRVIGSYPHFPGEDVVGDISPLYTPPLPVYTPAHGTITRVVLRY